MKITIAGNGAWGTALAAALTRAGHQVKIWGRDQALNQEITRQRRNSRYLKDQILPMGIVASHDWAMVLEDTELILLALPTQVLAAFLQDHAFAIPGGVPLISASKGIDRESHLLPSEIINRPLPAHRVLALSGPSFAHEVVRSCPTALTLAAKPVDFELSQSLCQKLNLPDMRLYPSADLVGVELCGAMKNILAIGAGLCIGAGLGENARASLIARGIYELGQLLEAKGGNPQTLMSLAGIGDLCLTALSSTSRNTAWGLAMGAGRPPPAKLAEGVWTAKAAVALARTYGIELPITQAIDSLIDQRISIDEAVRLLMGRPTKLHGEFSTGF